MDLPYLTSDLPGIGGRIRARPEDFQVDELPLYPASGEGTHAYFRLRKVGIPTPAAVERLARHMGVRPSDIGFAGLKDAHAVTTQWMSLEHADADKLAAFADKKARVLEVTHHTNKLRPGHLRANRFAIRIRKMGGCLGPADGLQAGHRQAGSSGATRSVAETCLSPFSVRPLAAQAENFFDRARATLDVLERRGVPNYFGAQRFGARGDTAALGRAIVAGDLDEFLALYLGRPRNDDPPDCRAARAAFDGGDCDAALSHWPRHYGNERRALSAFRKKRRPTDAVRAIDKRMKRLYVSAFQSDLFNGVLVRRIESIDRVFEGDMAQKMDSGGVFVVEDTAAEQPRADAFEISPTGPIVGYRGSLGGGEPGQIEYAVLAEAGVEREDFRNLGPLKAKGGRRPLRFKIDDVHLDAGSDEHGDFLEVRFTAGSGCYATVVLREIMKSSGPG